MDVNEKKPYTERSMFQHRGPDISRFRQFLNFLGCLVIIPVYYVITGYTLHPLTLDVLLTIIAAEYNRFANENRRGRLYRGLDGGSQAGKDPEKAIGPGPGPEPGPECMAAIVGYREDPGLFARALDSYRAAGECRFVLVGVDGDEGPDLEMVRVFQQVRSSFA